MLELIAVENLDTSKCQNVLYASSSAMFALLTTFNSSDSLWQAFATDASGKNAMRDAFAKLAGIAKSKSREVTYVGETNDGKVRYRPLRKNESPGKRPTKVGTVHSYSKSDRQAGEDAIRSTTGVAFKTHPDVSDSRPGITAYVLVREAHVAS